MEHPGEEKFTDSHRISQVFVFRLFHCLLSLEGLIWSQSMTKKKGNDADVCTENTVGLFTSLTISSTIKKVILIECRLKVSQCKIKNKKKQKKHRQTQNDMKDEHIRSNFPLIFRLYRPFAGRPRVTNSEIDFTTWHWASECTISFNLLPDCMAC